ncbi:rap guanine nucleotide exchange factor 1 [Physeter macrocephalus]|uniref:CRK SH3-binding GNRP n=1 Tax=Physeter macrocephalus TaxID=9755 RepID=A0A9W2X1X7_PHYMC|nr:rap guanine nucleotide exchange factor 1 [Physeter catodon]
MLNISFQNLSWLEEKEKEVVSALRYFKTIVDKMAIDKKVLEMLPGSASKVLEAILPLVQSDPRIQHSSALSSCYSRVYQSLANLIRWSDQVMLEGVNSEDKEMVTTVKGVIRAVLDGVKELVRLTIEKQGHPSPTSPVKPSSPACKPDGQSELPLTDREMEILNKTTGLSQSAEGLPDSTDEEVAPPKPPLPGIRVVDNSPPPALPPKKRQSAPSPTRVAVVAPMSRATSGSSLPVGINRQDFDVDCYAQRRLSGGSHSYGGESPRLSPCSSIGKLSKSDEQLSSLDRDSGQCSRNTSCETLDHYDPDYEFLQQDLSNADQIPQQVACNLSPLPESLGESGSPFLGHPFQLPLGSCPQPEGPSAPGQQMDVPPALPEKKRRSAASQTADSSGCRASYERHPSQYDNISEEDLQNPASVQSVPFTPFAAILPYQQGGSSASVEFVGDFTVPESTGDPEKPPPLPEKKNKHMLAYMQLLEDYSEPQPSMFYQTPQKEHIYQQKNKLLMEVYGFSDSFSAGDAPQELAPPPALPPKQRQLASYAAASFSSVSYCVQQTKVAFTPEDGSAAPGISVSVSHSFLSRHGNLPVPSVSRSLPLATGKLVSWSRPCRSCLRRVCCCPPPALSLRRPRPRRDRARVAGWPRPEGPRERVGWGAWAATWERHHPARSRQGCFGLLIPFSHRALGQPCSVLRFKRNSPPRRKQSPGEQVIPGMTEFEFESCISWLLLTCSVTQHPKTLWLKTTVTVCHCLGHSLVAGPLLKLLPPTPAGKGPLHALLLSPPGRDLGTASSLHPVLLSIPQAPCGGGGSGPGLLAGAAARGGPVQGSGCTTQTPRTGPRCLGPREPWSSGSVDTTQTVSLSRAPKSPDAPEAQSEEEVDELSLIDHNEIMARLTLKQEGDDGPDVRGGSGDILLVHATETDRKDLVLYCEAFLTTYRTFITPEELIKKLQYRYEKFSPFADTFKKRVSKNTFFVLVRVVDELCLVELTEEILKLLMELVFRLVCNGELSLARVLRKNILDKVDQKKLLRCANSDQPLAARGVAARPGTLHDFHSHEIAEQLTLLDAELFYKIEIPEVLLWAKEQNEEKSPNLTQFTEHFNNMSYWVRSIIMLQEKAQDRERLLLKFIKIMKHLRKLNNFNSYLAILSALDSAPIRRLEWQKQTSEGLAEYCTLIDSSSSFRAYRAALSEVEPPCIPYLGLILQDLTFVHLGNPDYIDGKVNFSKRWQQFNILDSMRCFQQAHYDIRRNDDIINFFNDFSDHLAEEALWELSLKIKPRNITRRKTDREEKT